MSMLSIGFSKWVCNWKFKCSSFFARDLILLGVIGAAFSPLILKHINDERASGLALGLAAHAIGTAQAWQRGSIAGRYAAFGMAVNAVFTAIWLPLFILYLQKM
jgi:putative effector of murein hydrolase